MQDIKQQLREELDEFLEQFTGKHETDTLYATLFADTVKVRKDIILDKICEKLSLAVEQEKARIEKAVNSRYEKWWEEAGNCNKEDVDGLMFDIINIINNK